MPCSGSPHFTAAVGVGLRGCGVRHLQDGDRSCDSLQDVPLLLQPPPAAPRCTGHPCRSPPALTKLLCAPDIDEPSASGGAGQPPSLYLCSSFREWCPAPTWTAMKNGAVSMLHGFILSGIRVYYIFQRETIPSLGVQPGRGYTRFKGSGTSLSYTCWTRTPAAEECTIFCCHHTCQQFISALGARYLHKERG